MLSSLEAALACRRFYLLAVIGLLLISPLAHAGEFKAFGPVSYQRGTGEPLTETTAFTVKDPTAPYVIRINNGGLTDGDLKRYHPPSSS